MLAQFAELREFNHYGFPCRGIFAKVDVPANKMIHEMRVPEIPPQYFTKREILNHPDKVTLKMYSQMVGDDCDPNTWYLGGTNDKIFTRRDVKRGEQFTYDYAMAETESSMDYGMMCRCGAKNCRGKLTFSEWRSPAFVKKYSGNLTSFILKKHLEYSWFDPRLELQYKPDRSMGLFTRDHPDCNIRIGETVLILSGKVVHRNELFEAGGISENDYTFSVQISKELWRIHGWTRKENGVRETCDHINHSCEPNCGMKDSMRVVAMRNVAPGDEITIDYAMFNGSSCTTKSQDLVCACKSVHCRGRRNSSDWKLPELQSKYTGFFSPFVQDLIASQNLKNNNGHIE